MGLGGILYAFAFYAGNPKILTMAVIYVGNRRPVTNGGFMLIEQRFWPLGPTKGTTNEHDANQVGD